MSDYDDIDIQGLWCNDSTGGLLIWCNACSPRSKNALIDHDGWEAGCDERLTLSRIIELVDEHRKQFHD
jgi:hypothetical protein